MTDEDYLTKSASAQQRLGQVRSQINQHVGKVPRRADDPIIRPLLDRQQVIVDEIGAIEREYWGT